MAPRLAARTFAALALALAVTAAAPASAGEPTAADAETALQLYKDGKARRDKGDLQGALEKLRAAYALVETPITALELGRTYAMTGKIVEAREVLLTVPRLPVRKNESKKATEARAEAEALASELKARLASVKVKVTGPGKASARISVDDVAIPPEAASAPRFVNPGAHVVVVDVEGKTARAEVTLGEGEAREVTIEAPEPEQRDVTPPAPRPEPEPERRTSPLVYAGFGTAAVAAAVGTVTGILTLSKGSTLDETCREDRCPPSAQADLDSATTTGTIATVAFVVAGAGLAVGAAGLLLFKPDPSTTSARVLFWPGGAGVRGTF